MAAAKIPPARVARVVDRARHHLYRLRQRMVPPPAAMLELIFSATVAQAITAAAELGVADALAKGPLSAEDLAARVEADPDALARLLRALIGIGVFRRCRDGRYALTPLAETLRTDGPESVAGMARWIGSPQHREHWSHVADSIRTGKSVVPALRGKPAFDYLADEPELGEIFNQAMTGGSDATTAPVIAAYDFTRYSTIVDVGGGHGRLLSAILAATPAARGVLFDQPQVVRGAPTLLQKYGVDDRVQISEGSFFDSVPAGGDAYVLKSIIHDWPDEDAVTILRNVRAATGAGSHVLLVEFVIPPHDRDFMGKWLDLEMLVALSARERDADEFRRLFDQTGFQLTRIVETASPFSVVEGKAL